MKHKVRMYAHFRDKATSIHRINKTITIFFYDSLYKTTGNRKTYWNKQVTSIRVDVRNLDTTNVSARLFFFSRPVLCPRAGSKWGVLHQYRMRTSKSLLRPKNTFFNDINDNFLDRFIQSNTSVEQVDEIVQHGQWRHLTGAHKMKSETTAL